MKMKFLIMSLLVLMMTNMTACRTSRCLPIPEQVAESEKITETVRDTVIVIEPDSAVITALIKCTENNRLILSSIDTKQGKHTTSDLNFKPSNDGREAVITVECKTDSLKQEIQLRDREIRRLKETTNIRYVDKKLSWWQITFMTIGVMTLITLLAAMAVRIFKR